MAKVRPVVVLIVGDLPTGRLVEQAFEKVAGTFGLSWGASVWEPETAPTAEVQAARRVVVLGSSSSVGLPEERTERWTVVDAAAIDAGVNRLVARLLGGGSEPPPEPSPAIAETAKAVRTQKPVVKVGRETKGRKGKGVTTISEVPLDAAGLLELAGKLKQRCGTGGSVEDGVIVLQGDQRERVTPVLEELGYKVKRVGG